MPLSGLRDKHGNVIPLEQVDPIEHSERLGASPATIAMLLRSLRKRDHLGDAFTASMIGKPTRQLYLEETTPYSKTVGEYVAAEMGTIKHTLVNVSSERIIADVRVWSKKYPWLSGEIDNAAIVDIVETDDQVTFVLDLFDLKSGGFYGLKLMWQDPWGEKAHTDYAWQINCCATLLEDADDEITFDILNTTVLTPLVSPRPSMIKPWRIQVRNLYIEWPARDSSYKHIPEAKALGIWQHQNVLIPIPRRSAGEVYAEYERKRNALLRAREDRYVNVCEDTWYNKTERKHLRCEFYCPTAVREACIRMNLDRGQAHHLATPEQSLAASIAMNDKPEPACVCSHGWSAHNYRTDGTELPDTGPCSECQCQRFVMKD